MYLKMLLSCVRAFLREFLQQVEVGQLPARHWLSAANQVLKLTTTHRSRKIAGKLDCQALLVPYEPARQFMLATDGYTPTSALKPRLTLGTS